MSNAEWEAMAGSTIEFADGLPDNAPQWMRNLRGRDMIEIARTMLEYDKWPTLPAPATAFRGVGPRNSLPVWLLVVKRENVEGDPLRFMVRTSMGSIGTANPTFYSGKVMYRPFAVWKFGPVRATQALQAASEFVKRRPIETIGKLTASDLIADVDRVLETWRPFLRTGAQEPRAAVLKWL